MIQEGDMVVIRMHDDKSSSLLRVKGDQKIGKFWYKMSQLVGHFYESVFEIHDKKIVMVDDDPYFLERAFEEISPVASSSIGGIGTYSYITSYCSIVCIYCVCISVCICLYFYVCFDCYTSCVH